MSSSHWYASYYTYNMDAQNRPKLIRGAGIRRQREEKVVPSQAIKKAISSA